MAIILFANKDDKTHKVRRAESAIARCNFNIINLGNLLGIAQDKLFEGNLSSEADWVI